jgi:hypothetical protein
VSITKVVVFSTTNPTKLSLHFSEFSTIFYAFISFSKWGILLKMQFYAEGPGKIWGQAIGSLDPRGGGLAEIRRLRRSSRPGKVSGSTTCSPRVGWRPWFGRRSRRRGCSAMAGGGGRGGSGSGERSAHGWKCEAC